MTEEVRNNYVKYRHYLKSYIKRDGIDNLIKFLDNQTDMAVAPASSKYHGSFEGGLVQHSLNVFMRLHKLLTSEYGDNCPYSKETIAVVALLHDISKSNLYTVSTRNVKDESGAWKQVPYYSVREDNLLYGGHEETSVFIISNFINLSYEERLAILHHSGGMGADSDAKVAATMRALSSCPLALFLHQADMQATCVDESTAKISDPSLYSLVASENDEEK